MICRMPFTSCMPLRHPIKEKLDCETEFQKVRSVLPFFRGLTQVWYRTVEVRRRRPAIPNGGVAVQSSGIHYEPPSPGISTHLPFTALVESFSVLFSTGGVHQRVFAMDAISPGEVLLT